MLQLYRPVKTNKLNQAWGENSTCVKVDNQGKIVRPSVVIAKPSLTCPVGYADMYKLSGLLGHNGQDWKAYHGEPVYHAGNFLGWLKTEHDLSGGLGVDVISNEPLLLCPVCNILHNVKLRVWHGLKPIGHDGKQISMGDLIMLADNSGDSSGDHVHYAPKWCDTKGMSLHTDNGYFGCFDPTPYFTNTFVLDIIGVRPAPLSIKQNFFKCLLSLKNIFQQ